MTASGIPVGGAGDRRIGLLGGTFDPPHLGHLVVAEVARVTLGLAEVRFVIAGRPWMKADESDPETRVAMAQLAVEGHPEFPVDRREVDRGGVTYTADTLRQLHEEEPGVEWVFLVGADAAGDLAKWDRLDECLELARFVVVTRPGHELDPDAPYADRLERLAVPLIDISSTGLRRAFREGGPVRFQLPALVEAYVRRHGLYGADHAN